MTNFFTIIEQKIGGKREIGLTNPVQLKNKKGIYINL